MRSLARAAACSLRLARSTELGGALVAARRFAADAGPLKHTPLYDYHVAHGGKMVPFAGWSMPIQYAASIMDSTRQCRAGAALFDVSHMCGLSLKGPDAIAFIEGLVVGDIAGLADGTGSLSVLLNERGGVIDDLVITKVGAEHLYMVVNAGCREKDLAHLGSHLAAFKAKGGRVDMVVHDDRALIALQGPKAAAAVQGLTSKDLRAMHFSAFTTTELAGIPCFLTRTGYTGEDGFEISVPNDGALALTKRLMEADGVALCGLGARDSLRLEAGLCLYGNDLNEDITPIEAGLAWTVAKRRRERFDFLGGAVIKKQLAEGAARRRVGLLIPTGAPARQHAKLLSPDGKEVGEVTSGGFSPCLGKNIAMGYVATALSKVGTALKVDVRGKVNDAVVTKMPFVPTNYYKGQ